MYSPPSRVITATTKVAQAATGVNAPNDVKNNSIAIIKYVQGSIVLVSFRLYICIRTRVPNECSIVIIAHGN